MKPFKIKLFMDAANIDVMLHAYKLGTVQGFTTNPTLMNKSGVKNYSRFAKNILTEITDLPISFEVFSDDLDEMEQQARIIARWAENVYIKIPITNTRSESTLPLIEKLSKEGFPLNVTAILTIDQVKAVASVLNKNAASIISVFAGRIADTGIDPVPMMQHCSELLSNNSNAELLWASPRELLNIFQAQQVGCHIITAIPSIINKLPLIGKDLNEYSLETVKMFYNDALQSGYNITQEVVHV